MEVQSMGYFSELDINNACYEDHSYPWKRRI